MISIALYKPDIPQNTAAIIRFASCFGMKIHIIEPCSFRLDDKRFTRVAPGLENRRLTMSVQNTPHVSKGALYTPIHSLQVPESFRSYHESRRLSPVGLHCTPPPYAAGLISSFCEKHWSTVSFGISERITSKMYEYICPRIFCSR